jgi:hypothetical protein
MISSRFRIRDKHPRSATLLLDVGLYFARITYLRFSEITATYACWIPRRGYSGLIAAKNVGVKTSAWDQNSCVPSQYACTQLSRARFPNLTAQQAWAGFFSVHKNRFFDVNTVGPIYKPLAGQQLLYSVLEGDSLCPWCKSDCVCYL